MVIPENYKKVLNDFVAANDNRRITLFAVLKMDELIDKWSIVIAAEWITKENRKTVFSSLIAALQKNLGAEELTEVARASFYSTDEHLVQLFRETFNAGQHIREDARVNGNVIHEGYIIALEKSQNE
ncbi:MAG TPA: hypothetical protein VNG90_04285 [Candidatus Acidoferrum sp.]|nr:hypothetical protein [Candidatus Acidoferrum sp.]